MLRKERIEKVVAYFNEHQPIVETELKHLDPYQLIVAVILSAQCTDKRVNQITPALFERFPTVAELGASSVDEVFQYIRSCSYPNNKAKHLVGMAKMLIDKYGGIVPSDLDDLQQLPGVGRKTANVIASIVYNKPVLAVDTHVFRVAARLGLSENARTPLETEKQLVAYIPEHLIPTAHHWLILHGRYVCTARSPKCNACEISRFCKYFAENTLLLIV